MLQIQAANSPEISFEGVMLFDFCLQNDSKTVPVPFLVTSQEITERILGYNVIEYLVLQSNGKNEKLLNSCFSMDICVNKIEQVMEIIEEKAKTSDVLSEVKVSTNKVIYAGSSSYIKCKVKVAMDKNIQTVLFKHVMQYNVDEYLSFSEGLSTVMRGRTQYVFLEVMNNTKKNIVLKKGVVIGELCGVSAVIPMKIENYFKPEVDKNIYGDANGSYVNSVRNSDFVDNKNTWLPKVDISHLNNKQRGLMEELLTEE